MSHLRQRKYVRSIRNKFPHYFNSKGMVVLDVGSQNLNGTNKRFIKSDFYIGCDLGAADNVDIICPGHKLPFKDEMFDLIISTEAFEHDEYLPATLLNIVRMLKSGGLFLFTAAGKARKEHGTKGHGESSSPFTNHYYRNVTEEMIREYLELDSVFSEYEFNHASSQSRGPYTDIRFYGVKR